VKAYADSNFVVTLYLQEQRSREAIARMERVDHALPFTPWHRLEVRNAIRLAVRQKLIDPHQGKTQLNQVDKDLREANLLVHEPIDWTDALRRAEELGAAHSARLGCRSADLFHVAAALELRCDTFLTFDDRQIGMAKAAGMNVKT